MNFLIVPSVAIAAVVAAVLLGYWPAETADPDAVSEPDIGPPANYSFSQHDKEKAIEFMDEMCSLEFAEFRSLNHTISNGELKRACSFTNGSFDLFFEIDATDNGVLVLDVPFSVFNPINERSGKGLVGTVNRGTDYFHSGVEQRYYVASYPAPDFINAHYDGSVDDYLYWNYFIVDDRQLIGVEYFEGFSRITFPFFRDDVAVHFGHPCCP